MTFTGDQLGALFASAVLDKYKASGKPLSSSFCVSTAKASSHALFFEDKLAMVASTVSSKMIEAMAVVEGFKFVECLTGMLKYALINRIL